jgi:branched-subunit amino acid transport protein
MNVWLVMALAGLLTYAIRLSFIAVLEKIAMPPWFRRALRFVPAAVLSAIIVPGLVDRGGMMDFSWRNPQIWSGVIAIAVAWFSRNVLLTIGAGMAALLLLQIFLK